MVTNAIEFEAKIDNEWKISVPPEYRGGLSSRHRVILLNTNADRPAGKEADADMQTRMDAFNRLNGLLKDCNIDLDDVRKERLSRQ